MRAKKRFAIALGLALLCAIFIVNSGQSQSGIPTGSPYPEGTDWHIFTSYAWGPYHTGCESINYDGTVNPTGKCTVGSAIKGFDYMVDRGTAILSPYSGRISMSCNVDGVNNVYTTVDSADGKWRMWLLHISGGNCPAVGTQVKRGDQVATSDCTGQCYGDHTHLAFEDLTTGTNTPDHDQFWNGGFPNTPDQDPGPSDSDDDGKPTTKTFPENILGWVDSKWVTLKEQAQKVIAWAKNNEVNIDVPPPTPDPANKPHLYQFSIAEQYSNLDNQWNIRATFAGYGQQSQGSQKVIELVQSGQPLEGSLLIPPKSTISFNQNFGWGRYEAEQAMKVAPGANGADYGNAVCNVASMINMVLSKEGIDVDVDDNTHPAVPGVEQPYWTVIYMPSQGQQAVTKDLRATNPFSYPVLLHWRVDGDTINLWVEKQDIVGEKPTQETEDAIPGNIIPIVIAVLVVLVIIMFVLRPDRGVVATLWVTKRVPTVFMWIKMSLRLALEWWLLLMVTVFVMQPVLRTIALVGLSQWLKGETIFRNWHIAVVLTALVVNALLRKYLYAKQIRREGGYFVESPPPRGWFLKAVTAVITLGLIATVAVVMTKNQVGKPIIAQFTGPCEISPNAPDAVRQWCDLITPNAKANGLDPTLVAAVMQQESGGDPNAISDCDAVGLLGVMPSDLTPKTIACGAINRNGVHVFSDRKSMSEYLNPAVNVAAGTSILGTNLRVYGSYRDALMHYGPVYCTPDFPRCGREYEYADTVLAIYKAWTGHLP